MATKHVNVILHTDQDGIGKRGDTVNLPRPDAERLVEAGQAGHIDPTEPTPADSSVTMADLDAYLKDHPDTLAVDAIAAVKAARQPKA